MDKHGRINALSAIQVSVTEIKQKKYKVCLKAVLYLSWVTFRKAAQTATLALLSCVLDMLLMYKLCDQLNIYIEWFSLNIFFV